MKNAIIIVFRLLCIMAAPVLFMAAFSKGSIEKSLSNSFSTVTSQLDALEKTTTVSETKGKR